VVNCAYGRQKENKKEKSAAQKKPLQKTCAKENYENQKIKDEAKASLCDTCEE
jgi:hypothetical protein